MKRVFTAFLATVLLCAACLVQGAEKKKEKIQKNQQKKQTATSAVWHSDMKKAVAAAKKSRKLILLVHLAPEINNNSKLFDQHIVKSKNLAKAAARLELVKFEYNDLKNISPEAKEAMTKYPVAQEGNKYIMPTVYVLDGSGNVLERKIGFAPSSPESYLKSFKSIKEFSKGKNKAKSSNKAKNKSKKNKKKSKKN